MVLVRHETEHRWTELWTTQAEACRRDMQALNCWRMNGHAPCLVRMRSAPVL